MKIIKKLLITFILILVFTSCSEQTPENPLTSVELTSNRLSPPASKIFTLIDDGFTTLETIIDTFDQYPSVSHSNQSDLTLTYVFADGTSGTYEMDLDLVNNNIYVSDALGSKIIDVGVSQSLLNSTAFTYLQMPALEIPTCDISYDHLAIDYMTSSYFEITAYNETTMTDEQSDDMAILTDLSANPIILTDSQHFTTDFDRTPAYLIQTSKNISSGEQTIYNQIDTLVLPDQEGTFEITLSAYWEADSNHHSTGSADYIFYVTKDLEPQVILSSNSITPGEIVTVSARNLNDNQTMMLHSDFTETEATYVYEGTAYGIIAVPCTSSPNTYTATVELYEEDVLISTETLDFNVVEREFQVDHLYVTESTAAIRTDDHAASDQVHFNRARANPTPYPLFEGPFIQPTEYERISTEYGVIRVTNDNWENTRRHYGIDFANTLGTPVYATNTGVVTLSYELYITGNTIIIDHGMGLFSMYYHLDELLVEEGQTVSKGFHIANMGTTGYSTGSHLHFGIWHDGVYLNPWSFFEDNYLTVAQ